MMYRFKLDQELFWFISVAVLTMVAQELLIFDGAGITDWGAWGVSLASGAIRAAAGALLAWFGRRSFEDDDPLDRVKADILALSPEERRLLAADLELHGRIEERVRRIPAQGE